MSWERDMGLKKRPGRTALLGPSPLEPGHILPLSGTPSGAGAPQKPGQDKASWGAAERRAAGRDA